MKLHREINMKKYTSAHVLFLARLLASLTEARIHVRLILSSFGICAAVLAGSFDVGAADAIYNLPDGVTPYIIDDADVKTINIKTPSEMKFLYAVDEGGNVRTGRGGQPIKALDWMDIPWATRYYFPVPVSDSREGTNDIINAYNGSIADVPSNWNTSTYNYLLAARIDNLQFLGGYYKYDFSVNINIAQLSSQFKGVKETGESAVYEPLDLVTGNKFLTSRANRILYRDPFNQKYYTDDSDRAFAVVANTRKIIGPKRGRSRKLFTSTGLGFDAVDGKMHTFWSSGNAAKPKLTIDLKEELEIDKIVIRWKGGREHTYALSMAGG